MDTTDVVGTGRPPCHVHHTTEGILSPLATLSTAPSEKKK